MSLPESIGYGTSVLAQATDLNYTMNKSTYGKYVLSTNLVDSQISLAVNSNQRKDGILDTWVRFEHFRNRIDTYVNAPVEKPDDRQCSVQIRVLSPISTSVADGRFTQAEILQRIRGMGSVLYTPDFLERLLRGEM